MQRFSHSRSFKTFILTGAALVAMSSGAQAQDAGEPELYFYPAAAWEVSKNEAMCSIGTTFNNGYIMRLSGDELWVDSMDVNFKQDIFNPDQSYVVGMSVPGVKNKKFQAQPASSRTLSVGLRKQKEFYKDMRDASVLDLNIDGNEFRFYMTGFANAAEKFERCMAGAVVKDERVAANALAERSEDRNFMVNESIAMEEKAKENQANLSVSSKDLAEAEPADVVSDESLKEITKTENMVDLTGDENAPVVQDLNVQETHKVGDVTIHAADKVEPEAEPAPILDTSSALAESTPAAEATPDTTPSSEAILDVADETPELAEMTEKAAESEGEEKLSEQLAEAVNENPDWIKSDRDKALSELARRQLEVPENVKAMGVVPKQMVEAEPESEPAPILAEAEDTPEDAAAVEDTVAEAEVITFDEPEIEASVTAEAETVEMVDVEPTQAVPPKDDMADDATVAEASAPVQPMPEAVQPKRETVNMKSPAVKKTTERYGGQADFATGEMQKDADAMRKQIVRMENTISQLKEENVALNKELKSAVRASEEERLTIASDNWNLEQATKQYNEAERQIKRLGLELQKERARHQAEKNELEALLFDPQVTNEAQLARLAQLEAELAQVKLELEKERSRFQQQMQKSWDGGSQ